MFDPWVGKIPWRRAWQPTPVFLPGESHRQRSLAGYSPWGHKESGTTERSSTPWHSNGFYRVYSGSQNETAKLGQISESVGMD